jgi:hypothetical protein
VTSEQYRINVALQRPQRARLELCLDAGVSVISIFWGDPETYMGRA